jgi:Kef-type K+ transport system membrane component KefB
MSHDENRESSWALQLAIVVVLVAVLIVLHSAATPAGDIDPTAMLAFGFVVLASYAIGHLVEVIRLPHITGYLLAGLLFGPSFAHLVVSLLPSLAIAPLDRGVLNEEVIDQLAILDTLAVALIAMTAGGELKIEGLRRGLKVIAGVLSGQTVVLFVMVTAFIYAVTGAFPALTLPGIGELGSGAALALGLVVAAISVATSPAATIAVINDVRARGPMSRTVLSTVVLKDVIVVVAFSVASVFASQMLGMGADDDLLGFLAQHILGSIGAGVVLGFAFALYLRYVGREVLLMIVGVVYTATLLATTLHLDPVLLFIAAGFTVSNNPIFEEGDRFIHNVEQLSMPVYVVFFTLAGARLHLDDLVAVFPWALSLVVVRAVALYVGVGAGARITGADPGTRKYGWLGFVSQAGVAISLSAIVNDRFGQPGSALSTLIIAGVALNEIIGPVALKAAIGFAGESGGAEAPPTSAPRAGSPPDEPPTRAELAPWPEPTSERDQWGKPPTTTSPELDKLVHDLRVDLENLALDVARGPLAQMRREAERYVQELRRHFLRHHRRLVVQSREADGARQLAERIHVEEAELATQWRGTVLGRGGRLAHRPWSPERLVESIDRLAAQQPDVVEAPWEPETFLPNQSDGVLRAARRFGLRARRAFTRALGGNIAPRRVPFRTLVRYHLSGTAPVRLEELAALLVEADIHLAERPRSLFDGIVNAYDRLADAPTDDPVTVARALFAMRQDVEDELSLALSEVDLIVRDGEARTISALARGARAVAEEIGAFGTLDLPAHRRRSSRVWFKTRMRALERLGHRLDALRRNVGARYSLLGLELELVGFVARIKDALREHVTALERDVEGRAHRQTARLETALGAAHDHVTDAIESHEHTGETLSATLRQLTEPLEQVAGEATLGAEQLREQMAAESTVAPLLDALLKAAHELTDRYEVPAGRLMRGARRLPDPVAIAEIPFNTLVTAAVEADIGPRLVAVTRGLASRVGPYVASLAELERLLAFNVELASAELDIFHDEPVPAGARTLLSEMLVGGIDRNREVVRGHLDVTAGWAEEVGTGLREAVLGSVDTLRRQLVDGELTQAQIDSMRRRAVGRQLRRKAERIPTLVDRSMDLLRQTIRRTLGEERLEAWRRLLGLPSRGRGPLARASFAAPRAAEHLPLVYRRLFAAETLEAGDVLTGREGDIERTKAALTGRMKGRLRAVALVGLDGVGKSAITRAVVRSRVWKTVKRIDLTAPVSAEEVDRWFGDVAEGQLVVVSGFHWLVAMRAAGFTPLRKFVAGVIDDGGRNAWLLHADLLVWEYACRVAPVADAFPEVVEISPLGPEALEAALLARHGLSGMGLSFDPLESDSRLEMLFARGASRIRRPYENFFSELHAASGGLVRDALRMWLAAVDQVDETGEFVRVGPVPRSPQAEVRRLPENILLSLYQVARQGWMDAAVQAHLFRVDATTAEAQLSRLAHMGLLERRANGAYRIARHLRGPVYRVLRERGWVR